MTRISDEEVIRMLRSADDQEKDRVLIYLYRRMYRQVHNFIQTNKGTPEDAEDIFQDGLIAIHKLSKTAKLDRTQNLEAYLYTICRNLWLKKLNKRLDTVEISDEHDTVPVEDVQLYALLEDDRKIWIDRILTQLGEDCKKLLLLYYYERLKMKEILQRMHYASEQAVKNKKAICMRNLKKIIAEKPEWKDRLR